MAHLNTIEKSHSIAIYVKKDSLRTHPNVCFILKAATWEKNLSIAMSVEKDLMHAHMQS